MMESIGYTPNYTATTLIVDGNFFLRRAMHQPSTRELSNSKGVPSGAIYSFFNSLKSTINSIGANALVVTWDKGHSERRKNIYSDYKVRQKDPDAPIEKDSFGLTDYEYFNHQYSWITKILELYGIPQLYVEGKEGDDVLYQTTRLLKGNKVIVSEDKDFYSLIKEDIACYRPIRKEYVDYGNFEEMTGYKSPRHFLYAKCILGDGSDNIPAVAKGCGESTVLDILNRIEDPEDVTTERILKEASLIGKARHNKLVAAGSVPINRNLDLVDISKESFDIFQLRSLIDILSVKVYPDLQGTSKIMNYLEFNPGTINSINSGLSRISDFPIMNLVDNSYLKKVAMNQSSLL